MARPINLQKFVSIITAACNYPLSLLPLGTRRLRLPGLTYSDYLRSGVPSVWSILKLLETGRDVQGIYTDHGYAQRSDMIGAIVAQKLIIHKVFYDRAKFSLPVSLVKSQCHISQRSFSFNLDLEDEQDGEILLHCRRQAVYLSPKTGQSVDVPETLRSEWKNGKNKEALKIAALSPSPHSFTHTVYVQDSDTDQLHHVNQAVYVRYCMDAAAAASRQTFLKNFPAHTDFFSYCVSKADILHQGEAFPGDTLKVCVWEDKTRADTLHFQCSRADKNILFTSLTFYMNNAAKL